MKAEERKEIKEFFVRGRELMIDKETKGIYLEKKGGGHWCLKGGMSGGKIMVPDKQLIDANFKFGD